MVSVNPSLAIQTIPRLLFVLLALLLGQSAVAQVPAELSAGESGVVVGVVDGDTVVLDNGIEVRLVGLQAPKLGLGRRNFEDWPLAEESRLAMLALSMGERVSLYYGGARRDRYDRALAHLERTDGLWLQEVMLARGMARVYSFADNRAVVPRLLAIERIARRRGIGIWAHPYYRIRSPAELERDIGSFQLVEGRVLSAAKVRGRLYFNFGEDWGEDFTVSVALRDRRAFEAAWDGADVASFAGQTVRVRGWLKSFNGPMIEATHPEQMEWFE
jgi:micrococcal nuclease